MTTGQSIRGIGQFGRTTSAGRGEGWLPYPAYLAQQRALRLTKLYGNQEGLSSARQKRPLECEPSGNPGPGGASLPPGAAAKHRERPEVSDLEVGYDDHGECSETDGEGETASDSELEDTVKELVKKYWDELKAQEQGQKSAPGDQVGH